MFRHSLAVYLLNNNISIPIISVQLDHNTAAIIMNMYLKATPYFQRLHLESIIMKAD